MSRQWAYAMEVDRAAAAVTSSIELADRLEKTRARADGARHRAWLLSQPIRAALAARDGATEVRVPAVNRRGRTMDANVRISALHGDGEAPTGVILLVDG